MKNNIYILLALSLVACGNNQIGSSVFHSKERTSGVDTAERIVLSNIENSIYRGDQLLVKFKAGVKAAASVRTHESLGAHISKRFSAVPNLELVDLHGETSVARAVQQYMSDPSVEYAEPNYIREIAAIPNDIYFEQQWGLFNTGTFAGGTTGASIHAPGAWDISTNSDVVIALVDTGIDYTHDDLRANIWSNIDEECTDGIDNDFNGYVDDCRGWDFSSCELFDELGGCVSAKFQDNDPMDDNGHGSHVAGIAGAVGDNAIGIAGVLWDVQLMPVKFQNAEGIGTVADEIEAIQYAINNGASIINASFGGLTFSQAESDAITAADNAGVIVVASAGNGGGDDIGDNNDVIPHYPSSYPQTNIIAVAATDQDDLRASFTNFGAQSVDVAAPGVFILSTIIANSEFALCTGNPFAGMDFCSGTSMAAPHVSALAGLLYSYYTHFSYNQVRSTILGFVNTIPSLDGIVATNGRVNAFKSMSSLLNPTDLVASASSATNIVLEWRDNAGGEDGYIIERDAGNGFIQIADTGSGTILTADEEVENVISFTDEGLSPEMTYSYRVRAYNGIGNSPAYSNSASATTLPEPEPEPSPLPRKSGGGGGCSVRGHGDRDFVNTADIILIIMPLVYLTIVRRKGKQKARSTLN